MSEKTLEELVSDLAEVDGEVREIENQYGAVLDHLKQKKKLRKEIEDKVREVALHEFVTNGEVYPHEIISCLKKERVRYPEEQNIKEIINNDDLHLLTIRMTEFKDGIVNGTITYAIAETFEEPSTVLESSKLWRYMRSVM